MNKISINKCVGGAWDLTTKHWIMCIIMLVTLVIVSIGSGSTSQTTVYNTGSMTPEESLRMLKETFSHSFGVFTLVVYIVQYAIYAGLYKMAINGYNGKKVDTSAYKMPFATYVKFIAAYIVYGILTAVGLCLCIIPGIIIGVRFMFTPLIILDEPETEIIEAFKKSWAMTGGNFWNLVLLYIVVLLINLVGIICCCIGVIFTATMAIFISVIAYYQLKDNVNDFGQPVTEI
mgnify:FL=1